MSDTPFPSNWQIASDFDPNDHMMSLKGRDYLNVQSRMVWFIRDQRALIAAGLATQPYRVDSDLVDLDRVNGWAHFRATVVDVLGNTSTAYGSESIKDFGDYIEKAATKALGRALIGLGYGTQYAPEMDEGERVVDAPVDRRHTATPARATATPAARTSTQRATTPPAPERTPAPSHSDAGRPTEARAAQARVSTPAVDASEWTTSDGYDPLSDPEMKRRVHPLGINNMADYEAFLTRARDAYKVYDTAALMAFVSTEEARHARAVAKVTGAAQQAQQQMGA